MKKDIKKNIRNEISKDKQLGILKDIIKAFFGDNIEIDFTKLNIESDKITIKYVDIPEDLIYFLNQLRDYFYICITSQKEEVLSKDTLMFGNMTKKERRDAGIPEKYWDSYIEIELSRKE